MPIKKSRPLAGSRRGATGSSSLREDHKALTRQRLIAAGREVFHEKNYVLTKVDDIAARARISRATFYLHYSSKDALLADIMAEDLSSVDHLYERLAHLDDLNEDKIADWLRLYVRVFRRDRRVTALYNTASALNEDVLVQIAAQRNRQIVLLGRFIPAFRVAEPPESAADRSRLMTIQLLMFKLEQFAYYSAFPKLQLDLEEGVRIIARDLWQFIRAS